MKVEKVVEMLQEIREKYPSLSNDEVLKILEIKTLIEIRSKL